MWELISLVIVVFIFVFFVILYFAQMPKKQRIVDRQYGENKRRYVLNKKEQREVVWRYSEKTRKIEELNKKFPFIMFSDEMFVSHECTSKRDFDRCDFHMVLVSEIARNPEIYKRFIQNSDANKELFSKYSSEIVRILYYDTERDRENYQMYSWFKQIEERCCEELIQHPVLDVHVRVVKSYCSPQGQRVYRLERNYSNVSITNAIHEAETLNEEELKGMREKEEAKYERNRMTDSLRYDILKRDNFRCVLCGASAGDGVKLHVDHIVPISKGGKTESRNLRTLCSRCNFGKGAKYDPYGKN